MQLKKLVLPVLSLFVLATLSYAAIPQISFEATNSQAKIPCNFEDEKPENEYPSLDSNYKFKMGKYAGRYMSAWELLENALTKNDKVATEIIKYCVRSQRWGDPILHSNKNGLNLLQVSAYYSGENSESIIKYLMGRGWDVNYDRACAIHGPNANESRTVVATAAEGNNIGGAKILKPKANPYIEIRDNNKNMTVLAFAENKSPGVYNLLKDIPRTTALIQEAAYKTINYALTNKNELSRLMEKIKSNGIVADFIRTLDTNSLLHTTYNLI
ncbi:MAG: hypothetical protein LBL61_00450 [Elusimicrobiota bacterium]|jgi:hypothetical protein|nr:hypothetical protein [Elusimicrobiota bacterium]